MSGQRLVTCKTRSDEHEGVHAWTHNCSNWREQPAQAEPRCRYVATEEGAYQRCQEKAVRHGLCDGHASYAERVYAMNSGTYKCPYCGKETPHEHVIDRKGNVYGEQPAQAEPPQIASNSVTFQFGRFDGEPEPVKCPTCNGYHLGGCHRKAAGPVEGMSADPRHDSFWVVEQFVDGKSCGYWGGGSSRDFQTDIEKAIQFCRREDAYWATRGWHWTDVKLTEHKYMQIDSRQKSQNGLPIKGWKPAPIPEAVEGISAEQPNKIIGSLLDAWEGINNDFRCTLGDDFPSFYRALQALYRSVESGEFWAEVISAEQRCGNCDHQSKLHNINGCTVRIQVQGGKTMVACPCSWNNLQASSEKI